MLQNFLTPQKGCHLGSTAVKKKYMHWWMNLIPTWWFYSWLWLVNFWARFCFVYICFSRRHQHRLLCLLHEMFQILGYNLGVWQCGHLCICDQCYCSWNAWIYWKIGVYTLGLCIAVMYSIRYDTIFLFPISNILDLLKTSALCSVMLRYREDGGFFRANLLISK
jgi:hypothetical protein